MNFLNIRKGPPMKFIVGEHRNEFEKHVIDLYAASEGGFWDAVPSLEASILNEINPKFILAGVLGKGTGDMSYYHKETHGKMLPEFEEIWAMNQISELEEEYPANVADGFVGTYDDAIAVLDYHHMCYMMTIGLAPGENGTGMQGMKSMPIVTVW